MGLHIIQVLQAWWQGDWSSPVVNTGHHQEGPAPYSRLHVYDLETGSMLGDVNPLLDCGTAPKSLDLVAQRLYAADAGGKQFFNNRQDARLAVLSYAERPLKLAENPSLIGKLRPVYGRDCLIIAGEGRLVCLSVESEEDRQWQFERMAEAAIAQIGPWPTAPKRTASNRRPCPVHHQPMCRW